jgi:hypothetical protein
MPRSVYDSAAVLNKLNIVMDFPDVAVTDFRK